MIIYKITNLINNKVYIGLTTTTLDYRWARHITESKNPQNTKHLYKAMRKYGVDNFNIEEIDRAETLDELGELERKYIKEYNSTDYKCGYNLTAGGERHQYDGNSQAKLTVKDVIKIRTIYNERTMTVKSCWETFFSHMSYSGFQKVWDGTTWKGIMDEVYTIDNINYYKHCTSLPGEKNGNALYTDKEVLDARCYYVHHTLQETYDKYHKNNQTKVSFRCIIDQGYKHLPIYSKLKKEWTLKGEKIDFTYKPVSTILGSEE